jgi:hypothetical protein
MYFDRFQRDILGMLEVTNDPTDSSWWMLHAPLTTARHTAPSCRVWCRVSSPLDPRTTAVQRVTSTVMSLMDSSMELFQPLTDW